MEINNTAPPDDEEFRSEEEPRKEPEGGNLVRLLKPVAVSPHTGKGIDRSVVSAKFYNCFNYSLLSKGRTSVNLAVGITSANQGEGKTLVASNLAVSLALANQRDTVLVDLSVAAPRLHSIFGTKLSPGLVEALDDSVIQVSQTKVSHLFVLAAGSISGNPMVVDRLVTGTKQAPARPVNPSLGLEQVAAFRDIVYSLKQEFEFVIVDMPAVHEPGVPVLLTHQMDGILVVLDASKTKQEDINKMFRRVHENQIIGFVFNRASEEISG